MFFATQVFASVPACASSQLSGVTVESIELVNKVGAEIVNVKCTYTSNDTSCSYENKSLALYDSKHFDFVVPKNSACTVAILYGSPCSFVVTKSGTIEVKGLVDNHTCTSADLTGAAIRYIELENKSGGMIDKLYCSYTNSNGTPCVYEDKSLTLYNPEHFYVVLPKGAYYVQLLLS